jgi:acyl-CoA thioesterase YciA
MPKTPRKFVVLAGKRRRSAKRKAQREAQHAACKRRAPGRKKSECGCGKRKTNGKQTQPERTLAIRMQMMPKDTNGAGNIFGGYLLSLMDLAGSHVARRACQNHFVHHMVTRFMDKVEFKKPVHVNDDVICYGRILKIGNTSVRVFIEVEVDRLGEIIPVTSCEMVFVALDSSGKPTPVQCAGSDPAAVDKTTY